MLEESGMAESTFVQVVHSGEKRQRCIIPVRFCEAISLNIGDYVTLQTSEKLYVCQVYTTEQPVACIYVDGAVTSLSFKSSEILNKSRESIEIPNGITSFKVSTFDTITVKIVLKNDNNFLTCDKKAYERVIQSLLLRYVFGKNCCIDCSDIKVADLLLVHSLVITETLPEYHTYGRINKNSKVEISDVLTLEQMYQMDEFKNVALGGINNSMNTLKLMLLVCQSNNVLITGPSGCGKSSFIKKFCTSIKCFFIFIDGLKNTELTLEKCSNIRAQFSSHLKLFPNKICMLIIDHINVSAPYDSKTKSSVFLLLNLVNSLKDLNVFIIGAAVAKTDINSAVSAFFNKEVNLGIPSLQQRKEIIRVLGESMNCAFNYDEIAQMTPGFVAHDISSLIMTAVAISKVNVQKESDVLHLTNEDFEKALANISPSVLKTSIWNVKVKPVYWKDIGGMFTVKQKLQMCVEWPLHNPSLFKKVDLPCPHGVLLFGPPGCCKTTLARGLATECNANFFAANPAQIYSSFVGESEKNITELFYQARLCAPSIIFLDELDSLVSQRKLDSKSQGVGEKVLSCLLNEMDGFGSKVQFQNDIFMQKLLQSAGSSNTEHDKVDAENSNDVIVVAATNRPDLIDDALLRPGRFDIILYVAPPNEEERESILHCLTEKMPLKNINIKEIAVKAELFSGADLKSLCNEAAMNALRQDITASFLSEENFNEALKKIKPSITKQQLDMYEKLSSKYGSIIK